MDSRDEVRREMYRVLVTGSIHQAGLDLLAQADDVRLEQKATL
jgi:hypothetical protein